MFSKSDSLYTFLTRPPSFLHLSANEHRWMLANSTCMKVKGQPWVLLLPFYLDRHNSLLFWYTSLTGPWASGDRPVPASYLKIYSKYTSGFYVHSGDLNSGSQVCLTHAFTHWAISLAPLLTSSWIIIIMYSTGCILSKILQFCFLFGRQAIHSYRQQWSFFKNYVKTWITK